MASDDNMGRLGFKLKKARENKGYSIEYIQKITKLRARYIKAIEENDFSIFSGDVYAKGSIRNYADIVGIDYKELWEEYELHYKMDQEENNESEASEVDKLKRKPKREKRKKRVLTPNINISSGISPGVKKGLVTIIVLALVIVGLRGGYNFIMSIELEDPGQNNNHVVENEDNEDNNELNEEEENELEEEIIEDEPEISLESVEEYNDWDAFNYRIINADEIEVEGNIINDRCWLGNFIVDGEPEPGKSRTYEENEGFSLTAKEEFVVLIGRPLAFELIVNGISVDFISDFEEYEYSKSSPFYLNIILED